MDKVGKRRPGPAPSFYVLRRGLPSVAGVLALPEGATAFAPRSLGQGPDLRAHHPAAPPLARPIRRRRPPRHPVHDPGSREGGDVDY